MKTYYIGAFPPGWGGVTIKNRDLFVALHEQCGIQMAKIDLHKITREKKITELLRLAFALLDRNGRYVVGISTGKNTRRNFAKLLYTINRTAMKRSIILIMGGTDDQRIAKDEKYRQWMSCFKKVYVEISKMKQNLESAGMTNVAVYPNGRFKPKTETHIKIKKGKLKCVYFSDIQEKKGADIVLETASQCPDVAFDFYGAIDLDYREKFISAIEKIPNANYKGVFKGTNEEVYLELSNYDILLFPTKWDTEGVPGILVEGKIAGLAEIVSDKSHNAELVKDNVEGIVLKENTSLELSAAIRRLNGEDTLLNKLKKGSKQSAQRFYIENHMGEIENDLR